MSIPFSFRSASALFASLLLFCASTAWSADHIIHVGGQTQSGGDYGYGGGGYTPILMFAPATLSINAGDTVTFVNDGGATHNIVSDTAGLFRCAQGCDGDGKGGNGTPSAASWTATIPFNTAGTFGFHCEVHQAMGMTGTITVNAVAPTFSIGGGITGSWYNTDQSGHGFNIEVLPNNGILAFWYVFDGSGKNLWLVGQGTYSGNTANLDVSQVGGGAFPPNFDASKITRTPWGKLAFSFSDCNTGTAAWTPSVTGFSTGSLGITRLSSIGGLACP